MAGDPRYGKQNGISCTKSNQNQDKHLIYLLLHTVQIFREAGCGRFFGIGGSKLRDTRGEWGQLQQPSDSKPSVDTLTSSSSPSASTSRQGEPNGVHEVLCSPGVPEGVAWSGELLGLRGTLNSIPSGPQLLRDIRFS